MVNFQRFLESGFSRGTNRKIVMWLLVLGAILSYMSQGTGLLAQAMPTVFGVELFGTNIEGLFTGVIFLIFANITRLGRAG